MNELLKSKFTKLSLDFPLKKVELHLDKYILKFENIGILKFNSVYAKEIYRGEYILDTSLDSFNYQNISNRSIDCLDFSIDEKKFKGMEFYFKNKKGIVDFTMKVRFKTYQIEELK